MRESGTIKISLSREIVPRSLNRPEGYLEDVLSGAKIEGDTVELTEERYRELVLKYQGAGPKRSCCGQ